MYMCVVLVYFHRCVNKTPCDKGGACANEKWKQCNRIPSDITLDRNYAAWGYY